MSGRKPAELGTEAVWLHKLAPVVRRRFGLHLCYLPPQGGSIVRLGPEPEPVPAELQSQPLHPVAEPSVLPLVGGAHLVTVPLPHGWGWLLAGPVHRTATSGLAPQDLEDLTALLELLAASASPPVQTDGSATKRQGYDSIVGASEPMQELYRLLDRLADSDVAVLILGENGTGKELVARAIHAHSTRRAGPFFALNCSAFNDNLLDSELFGHRRGAFTGAVVDKPGLFEAADGGTFFLDEIGDMSAALQTKLLRVLQDGTFTPVGSTEVRHVDVRVIAATNRDLRALIRSGDFREDLLYRVDGITLVLPPLRERIGDLPALIGHFLARTLRGGGKKLSQGCLEAMSRYAWPGNVRELENELERLVVLSGSSRVISADLLSRRILAPGTGERGLNRPRALPDAVEQLERKMIQEALDKTRGNKSRAAAELRISRRNLIRKVSKYKLDGRKSGV